MTWDTDSGALPTRPLIASSGHKHFWVDMIHLEKHISRLWLISCSLGMMESATAICSRLVRTLLFSRYETAHCTKRDGLSSPSAVVAVAMLPLCLGGGDWCMSLVTRSAFSSVKPSQASLGLPAVNKIHKCVCVCVCMVQPGKLLLDLFRFCVH